MKSEKIKKLDMFLIDFCNAYYGLEHSSQFLRFDRKQEKIRDEAISILKKKIKSINKAKTPEELASHIKIKRIVKKED